MRRFIFLITVVIFLFVSLDSLEVQIGNGVETDKHLPMSPNANHTVSQTIYDQELINLDNHAISQISYYYSGNDYWIKDNIKVYLGHTDLDSFDSNDSWITIDNLNLVYAGPLELASDNSAGWVAIPCNYPFAYNNIDNLVIAFETDDDLEFFTTYDDFYCTGTLNQKSIFRNNDDVDYNLTNPPAGIRSNYIANVKLNMNPMPENPTLHIIQEDYNWENTFLNTLSSTVTLELRNSGLGTLNINSVTLDQNTDFILTDNNIYPLSLTTNSAQFTLRYHPLSTGNHQTNLIINDSQIGDTVLSFTGSSSDGMIYDFPYYENFTYEDNGEMPENWNSITGPEDDNSWVMVTFNGVGPNGLGLEFHSDGEGLCEIYAISPPISDLASKRIKFKAYLGHLNELSVGVCDTNQEIDNFQEIQLNQLPSTNQYIDEYFVDLYTENEDNKFIVFEVKSNEYGNTYSVIYDIIIEDTPTETIPLSTPASWEFSEMNIHNTSVADFILQNYGSGQLIINSVDLYQESGFTLVDDNEYPLSIIDQLIPYSVVFSPDTAGSFNASLVFRFQGRSELIVPLHGTTIDPAITLFPHLEDFESVADGELPPGWTHHLENYGSNDSAEVTSQVGFESSKCLKMSNSTNYPWKIIALTPAINNLFNKHISFQAKSSTNTSQLQIGSATWNSGSISFVPVETFDLSLNWNEYEYSFTSAQNLSNTLAFKLINNNFANVNIYIDNVLIEGTSSAPLISVNDDIIDFGDIFMNRTGIAELVIGNNGGLPLEIELASSSPALWFEVSELEVAPETTEKIRVYLSPTNIGEYSEAFTILTNDATNPAITINTIANILPAPAENISIIGTGSEVDTSMPVEANYHYSYSQAIYFPQEIANEISRISTISWYYNGNSAWGPEDFIIYMGHTDHTEFANNEDWINVAELNEVYNGTIYTTSDAGWIDFNLDLPFDYNPVQNLLVAVEARNQTCHSISDDFYCTRSYFSRGMSYFTDNEAPDLTNPPLARLINTAYPNIKLEFSEIPDLALLSVLPLNANFLPTAVGQTSVGKTITMKSIGLQDVIITTPPIVTGTDASDFSISSDANTYPLVMPFNDIRTFTVAFSPLSQGNKSAIIELVDSSNRSIKTVEISGFSYIIDNNDSPQTATYLTLPVEGVSYEIVPDGDIDWYKIPALGIGDTLTVYCESEEIREAEFNFKLYGPSNNPNSINVHLPLYSGSSLEYLLPQSGDYYLRVQNINSSKNDIISHQSGESKEKVRFTAGDVIAYELFVNSTHNFNYNPPGEVEVSNQSGYVRIVWVEPPYQTALVGYKLYRNDVLMTADLLPLGTRHYYDYNVVWYGEYSYYLQAFYENPDGFSLPSETLSIVYQRPGLQLIEDDFEEHPDFCSDLPNWIQLDLDQSATFQIPNVEYPNSGEPASFMVFNPSATIPPMEDMSPQNGNKFLISFTSITGANNDWLISHVLDNNNRNYTLYFYAKSYSNNSELAKFKLSFTNSADEVNINNFSTWSNQEPPTEWTLYSYPIHKSKRRIAIQNISFQSSALMIDNLRLYLHFTENEDTELIPNTDLLSQNYPNPFNPETAISFSMKEAGNVSVDVYNIKGQKVKTLLNEYRIAGSHNVVWNGRDEANQRVASGVYLYNMKIGSFKATKKMILMK